MVELLKVGALERELVERLRELPADADRGRDLREDADAGNRRELGAELLRSPLPPAAAGPAASGG